MTTPSSSSGAGTGRHRPGRPDPADQVDIARSIAADRCYIRILVDAKVSERADDLTSDLLAIHDEDPERLTLDEISSILFSLVIRLR